MGDLQYCLLLSWLEQAGVCYAFVEFEDATSAQSAIEVCLLPPFCFHHLVLPFFTFAHCLMFSACAGFTCTYRWSCCLY